MLQAGQNLKDLSVVELKALAYDFLVQREQNIQNLQAVNQAIAEAVAKPVEPIKEE
jgi:transketolase